MPKLETMIELMTEKMVARDKVEYEFAAICREGRLSPVPMDAFVQNRIKYMAACEAVYETLWLSVADTGVQILRKSDDGKKEVNSLTK